MRCSCQACFDRNKDKTTWKELGDDVASCGYCGLTMHYDGWMDESYYQYKAEKPLREEQ